MSVAGFSPGTISKPSRTADSSRQAATRRADPVRPQLAGRFIRHAARRSVVVISLALADGVSLLTVVGLSSLALGANLAAGFGASPIAAGAAWLAVSWLLFQVFGLYSGPTYSPTRELRQSFVAVTHAFVFLGIGRLLAGAPWGGAALVVAWLAALAVVPLARAVNRHGLGRWPALATPVLIIGSGPSAVAVYRALRARPQCGLRPVGLIDDWPMVTTDAPHLGGFAEAPRLAKQNGVLHAVIALAEGRAKDVSTALDICSHAIPHIWWAPDLAILPSLGNRSSELAGRAAIELSQRLLLPLPRLAKRAVDLGLALVLVVLGWPLFLLLCLAVKASSPGPVFYRQERLGRGGRRFYVWKFRTMVRNADEALGDYLAAHPEEQREWEANHKLRRDPRVTWAGRFLRRTSLDELPQVWNVIRGEMSLVGPRPIVVAEIPKYGDRYRLYARVVPGVTGLWQVSGRNNTTYEERVQLDTEYVRNWSCWLDLYILIRTVKTVLLREGAY